MELRQLLAAHELVRRERERGHRLAGGGRAELGVARETTGEKDPVHGPLTPCFGGQRRSAGGRELAAGDGLRTERRSAGRLARLRRHGSEPRLPGAYGALIPRSLGPGNRRGPPGWGGPRAPRERSGLDD